MGAGHASTSIGYAVGLKEAMRHGERRGRQGRRGDRRRRDDRRRRVRGDPPGRRPRHADRRRAQRQRHVDRAERRRAVALLQPRAAEPELWHAREGVEERLTKLPAGIGAAFERLGPQLKESIKAFWAPGPVVGGARLGLHGRHRRPRRARAAQRAARGARGRAARRRAHRDGQGQGLRARPRTAAWRAWRSGTPPSRSRSPTAHRPAPAAPKPAAPRPAAVHAGLRRGARARVRARRARRRHHRRDELRHRPARSCRRRCPTATSTSASPSSRPCCSPPASRSRARKPVCAIYSTFLQRAYDQIVHDVCLQSADVVFAMDRAGLVGDDGPTHHGAFDIAYLRCLPNIVLMAPRDEAMLVHMLHTALDHDGGPVAIRYPRGEGVGVPLPARAEPIEIGTGEILREGERVALARLRHRRRQGARGRRAAGRARARRDGRRRPLRQADRRRAAGPARRRARPARDGRGGRARRRLRLGRVGDALRGRRSRRASCASACPTATSPTASRRCCTRRSASPAERIAERIEAAVLDPHGSLASA